MQPLFRSIFFVLIGSCILSSFSLQAQTITLQTFDLESDGADVLLSWELSDVSDVAEFRLFRRLNQETTSLHVTTMTSDPGLNFYSYLDDGMFKQDGRVVHYELQVVTKDSRIFSFSQSLTHNPTSIQRTWGSIKAMFRD